MRYIVEALNTYEKRNISDGVLKRVLKEGNRFEVDKERLDVLLGDNPHKLTFVKLVKEIKEKSKEGTTDKVIKIKESSKEDKPKTTTKKKAAKKVAKK